MVLEQADEVRRISAAATDLARGSSSPANSVHLLLAMFVSPCAARDLLTEVGADHDAVLQSYRSLGERDESPRAVSEVWTSAAGLAENSGATEVDSACLLAGLLRVRQALAARVLRGAGIDVIALRSRVIGQLTLGLDRAGTRQGRRYRRPSAVQPAHQPFADVDQMETTSRALPLPTGLMRAVGDRASAQSRRRARRVIDPAPWTVDTSRDDGVAAGASGSRVEAPSAILSHRGPAPRGGAPSSTQPAQDQPPPPADPPSARGVPAPELQASNLATSPQLVVASAPLTMTSRGVFYLDPDVFPVLTELGRNLTEAALNGEIQPLIGRNDLVDGIIDVLMMRQVNNPCLVGEAGVGKTAIVEGLARRLAGNVERFGSLGQAAIIEISVSGLLAGTSFRGAFSQRMKALRDEVAKADGQIIIFMDELHTIMGAGAGDGPLDAANDLKTALARGRFPLIGATTQAEYRRHIEKDPAMERRLQVITVPEPSVDEAITILAGVAPIYARHHGLAYAHEAVVSAVHLSKRFITDRCLPDKAIAVLDRAGAQARRRGKSRVEADDVSRAVHQLTQVPLDRLLADERSRVRDLGRELIERIIGHDATMERVARRVQRNYAGFAADRPLASFLFVGTPGTGKTAAAYALSETLFLVDDALVRFDMNEYADSHSVSRLIGSPPGYVGHQQPGLLSQAIHKRPYRVLLFDDIDRAAPEVVALLLQIVDTGRLTDNQGHVLDLRNAILVMTSTVPVAALSESARPAIGFGRAADAVVDDDETVLDRVRDRLGPELWGRVDDKVLFRPLPTSALRAVTSRCIEDSLNRLFEARLVRVHADVSVVDLVLGTGGVDAELGVRPLRSRVEALVEAFLADHVLEGTLQPGTEMRLHVADGALELSPAAAQLPPPPEGAAVATAEGAVRHPTVAHPRALLDERVPAQATAPTQTSRRERP